MSKRPDSGPHPRSEPRFPGPLTQEGLEKIFAGCSDFAKRPALIHDDPSRPVTLYYINGMVRGERINDYLLRPLSQDQRLAQVQGEAVLRLLEGGALTTCMFSGGQPWTRRPRPDHGLVSAVPPGEKDALSFFVGTEEKRSVGEPENEPALKGARDSFVESILTNTSLVRRRLRAPELKVRQHIVGRQSLTPVMVVYLDGVADPETVSGWRRGWIRSTSTGWRRWAIWRNIWSRRPLPPSLLCPTPSGPTASARGCWRAGWACCVMVSLWAGWYLGPLTSFLKRVRTGPTTGLQPAP